MIYTIDFYDDYGPVRWIRIGEHELEKALSELWPREKIVRKYPDDIPLTDLAK